MTPARVAASESVGDIDALSESDGSTALASPKSRIFTVPSRVRRCWRASGPGG
jgi:hypothetical protein